MALVLTVALAVPLVGPAAAPAHAADGDWWDTNWGFRSQLTLDNAGLTENLTNFPVLVCLNSSTIDYSQTQDNGEDIRFVDGDGTVLAHEIEEWDEAGTSCVWVKVPQIDAAPAVDYIWMYYGNPGAPDGQDAENVWDTQFQGVWHLNRSSGDVLDSTSNDNDGTNVGSTRGVSGRIDSAFDFDGANDYINVGDVGSNSSTAITVEAWIYHHAIGDERIICKSTGTDVSDHIFSLGVDHQTNRVVRARLGTDGTGGGTSSHDSDSFVHEANRWEYVAFTWNSSDTMIRFYSNGQPEGTASRDGDSIIDSTQVVTIASVNTADGRYFDGLIDEPRISSTARSAEWIEAQYKSMTCDFIVFGPQEQVFDFGDAPEGGVAYPYDGCEYEICLEDTFGDGWQFGGNYNTVDVYVNGNPVYTGLTLAGGSGPECHPIPVQTGDEITVDYTGGDGWEVENEYYILDANGVEVRREGAGGVTPGDVLATELYAACDVVGQFPTCITVGPATWIQHGLGWAHFAVAGAPQPPWDAEPDGNAGLCPPCVYEICLYDDYGDGWADSAPGVGTVNVSVNGNPVYTGLTLAAGSGPECHPIPIQTGDEITVDYTGGPFPGDDEYYINDADGVEVRHEGAGHTTPGDVLATELYASCPGGPCFPPYDQDECFADGDAGLMFPEPYTINGTGAVVTCPNSAGTPLGPTCQQAVWGTDVDIWVVNTMDQHVFYVNVLMDWNQDGQWAFDPSTTCTAVPVPEHVLVDFPIPPLYNGPLSGLGPPTFTIGPNPGYVWTRFTISERPVLDNNFATHYSANPLSANNLGNNLNHEWHGEGIFEDGETEDYLLRVDEALPEMTIDKDVVGVAPVGVAPGGTVQYIISVTNTGTANATGVSIWDTLGTWFTYASTDDISYTGGAGYSGAPADDFSNLSQPTWKTFTIPSGGSVTITFTADVDPNIPVGTYQNTAYADGDNFTQIDDLGPFGQDADTPPLADPEEDENVFVAEEPPPQVVTGVPTLSQWGMIAMGILFAAFLIWTVRRRWAVSAGGSQE